MDKAYKTWDNNPKEDNLEDRALVLEQLESSLFDDDYHGWPDWNSYSRGFMFNSTSIYTVTSGFEFDFGSISTTTCRFIGKSWWCKEEEKIDRN